MKGPRKSRLQDAASEIDLRLGDLLGQLGDVLAEAAERLESGDSGEVRREREFDTGSGPIRASAGIRISTLGARTGTARPPSGGRRPDRPVNTPQPEAPSGPVPRRVDATVFDEQEHWFLVADMPGITRADVTLTATGDTLRIEAVTDSRHYILETPRPAGWARFEFTVQNGILEVQAIAQEAGA
jgi:HSP20 family molecular chaperone IbpA